MGQFDEFLPKIGLPQRGNRAFGESVVVKKPKVADKKEPASYKKKRPPEGGLGALVRK